MNRKLLSRLTLVVFALIALVAYRYFELSQYLSLESLKDNRAGLLQIYEENPLLVWGVYLLIYVLSTALSLPGATILTLAGGAIFGLWIGVLLVSVASTVGATLAFLVSRFILQDFVRQKFGQKLSAIDRGVQKEGAFYLFTLRLVPLFPFFLINLLMGLTTLRTATFFFVSQIGMLPGTLVYVNAGTQLSKIESLKGILSPELLLSFAFMGILPLFSKWLIGVLKSRKHLARYKKPKSFDYNMVVIGGGSAGLVSAYIAAAVKSKVVLIEKHKMGGDCLNTGCVPSKALIRSAKVFSSIKKAHEFGLTAGGVNVDFTKVMERVHQVIKDIEPHDSVDRYTGLGVECIKGSAKITSPYTVEVNGRTLTTKNIVVATGARPHVPDIPGLSDVEYLTSDTLWGLKTLPKRLVVLGGGSIGCELAQSLARLGSQVTLIERGPRLMSREDEDVSEIVQTHFEAEAVDVRTHHKAIRVDTTTKEIICEYQGKDVRIGFDQILVALGRKANVTGFGLEELGVELSNLGTIVADDYMRTTNFPNIYVCGDVTGPYQFTHTASHQAWYVAVNALFSPFKTYKVDYRVIPWCTFTDPEVARVGLSEIEAKAANIAFEVTKYGIDDLDRAIAEGEAHGFVKVLTPPNSDKILGVTIVGPHAGEIISEYVTAMKYGLGLNKILGTIHIYPTLSEANKFAAGVWKKKNAPQAALNFLAKFHSWRRR